MAAVVLAAGVLVYAAGGVPAPERVGMVEAVVATALCAVMLLHGGRRGLVAFATVQGTGARLLAMLALPAGVTGALCGAPVNDLLRDAVALTPFAMPVILAGMIREPEDRRRLADLLALAGAVIAARYLALLGWPPHLANAASFEPINLAYLPNEPLVAFAAGLALTKAGDRLAAGYWATLAVWSGIAAVAAIALAASLQRGALAALGVTAILIGLKHWRRRWRLVRILAPLGIIAAIAVGHDAIDLLRAYLAKTRVHGANARLEEIEAAFAMATASPRALVLGQGWGIRVETPTVPGYRVLYMHVLPALLLAKTGLVGLLAALAAARIAWPAVKARIRDNLPEASALLGPILIACTLHTGYRTLGFGLLLLLLGDPPRRERIE